MLLAIFLILLFLAVLMGSLAYGFLWVLQRWAERKSRKPVVFRLDGTNVDQVPGIFSQFGAHNHARLEDAVAEAVTLAKGIQ